MIMGAIVAVVFLILWLGLMLTFLLMPFLRAHRERDNERRFRSALMRGILK